MNKKKINILDILILLLIIGGIFFGYRKINQDNTSDKNMESKSKIRLTYYVEEVMSYTADSIQTGDEVVEKVQGSSFGQVVDKDVQEAVSWGVAKDGKYVKSSRPNSNSVTITMEAEGVVGDHGIAIDKSTYYIGQTLGLYIGDVFIENGRLSGVEIVE